MFSFPSTLLGTLVGHTVLLPLTVALLAFFFEDATIIIVGVLAADGVVPIPVALLSLYTGIVLSDVMLYALGAYARTHPRLARYINHDFTAPFLSWLRDNYAFKVFSGHFIPGFRFTTFSASGFFRLPLTTYVPSAIAGGLVLLTVLFSLAYWFGSFTTRWAGHLRWSVAALFIIAIFILAWYNLRAYRARQAAKLETTL